ncbi:MAG: tryptophanase [Myxococcales bacterium]|nr:tryptophanase [Myxococcales bacterium]MCB9700425.1 tryptophanase [Myxococcales bacterium]
MRSRERLVIPYRSKVVEPISLLPREERLRRIEAAGLNVFRLRSSDVYIDLLTDSGTGAISSSQLSRAMLGDESYAGSRSFEEMQQQVKETLGFPFTIPVHQGRAAEQVLNYVMIRRHMFVPGNTHFDTTKAHIELAEGRAIDCTIDAGRSSEGTYPFKGNVAVSKLERVIEKYGARHIAYILITITCNSGGGQPVSMQNIRDVRALASAHGLPLVFDAARFAENAYFIKDREPGYQNKSIPEIVHEMFGYADACTMSAKKDAIVPMGGFIACRDEELYERLKTPAIIFEGYFTYGGMSGADMEMLAQGLREVVDEAYLTYRVGQVRRFGELLQSYGVPVVEPIGGHAVFIDGRKFFPNVPEDEFPAQLLCAELYKEGGVRAVEVGSVLVGRDPDTGENIRPSLDLCRLTIPRRVYTFEHLEYVADAIRTVFEEKGKSMKRGICFDQEAEGIRHFSSTFRYL